MDSYQGSIYDPVTIHKYLYANANPVKYTDPSGYNSEEAMVTLEGHSILAVEQAWNESIMFKIGMNALSKLYATEVKVLVKTLLAVVLVDVLLDDHDFKSVLR